MKKKTKQYPSVICNDCGRKHGRRECGMATWSVDKCDVCGETKPVTQPRDFGGLREGWDE